MVAFETSSKLLKLHNFLLFQVLNLLNNHIIII